MLQFFSCEICFYLYTAGFSFLGQWRSNLNSDSALAKCIMSHTLSILWGLFHAECYFLIAGNAIFCQFDKGLAYHPYEKNEVHMTSEVKEV